MNKKFKPEKGENEMNMADYNFLWIYLLISFFVVAYSNESCPHGSFGWKCRLRCDQCIDNKCDPVTGECLSACRHGYTGTHCLFDDACKYDSAGITYTGQVSKSIRGQECIWWHKFKEEYNNTLQFETGDDPGRFCRNPVIKHAGSTGRLNKMWCFVSKAGALEPCDIKDCECPPHLYGSGCTNQCHCKSDTEICSIVGKCQKSGCADGWVGSACERKCAPGKYGPGCQLMCKSCLNQACHHEDGKCLDGCPIGLKGVFCDQVCSGSYGRNCQNKCGKCDKGEVCEPNTGVCENGCLEGFGSADKSSKLCDISCETQASYGRNCVFRCAACKHGTMCDSITGVCPDGCQDGYVGAKCDSLCVSYWYGKNCLQRCGVCKDNSSCDPLTGRCPDGCGIGHTGFGCTMRVLAKSDTTTIAIGAGLGVGVLLILVILILCIAYRRNRHKNMDIPSRYVHEVHDHMPREESCQLLGDSRIGSEPPSFVREEDDNVKNEGQEPIYVNVTNKKQSSPVLVPDLYDYIMKNKEHSLEGFKREFEELPMGLLASSIIACKQENKVKNRYGKIVAYDHSRVILEPLPNEPFSDYVNANYMDGYSTPRAYIASQGPNKVTIRDFWRMVWQQRVSKIVMLTNLNESCKKKCEQYWPDEGANKYGELTVLPVNTTKYTDFVIRTFEVSKENELSRIVIQFHFTSWSDHGAPTYPTTLLAFRRKVQNFKPDDKAPILSHCSAGIGRTGTYIALDFLLEQAARENRVDVLKCAQAMRSNRVNMIQTLEQYVFVYEALLEGIISGNSTIPRSSFHSTYDDLVSQDGEEELPIQKQYDVLQLLTPTIDRAEYYAALLDVNVSKNRFKNILPANRSRPFLYTTVEGCSDYINAVYLSGYTQQDQFIVTQMPLPNTVADFWRMMYDTSSDTIIMLNEFDRNDKSCALYWPEEYGYSVVHGSLSVDLLSSSETDPDVTIRVFKLSHKEKGEERAIKQFMFKSWTDYQTTPNSVTPLLRLHKLVNEWLKQNSKGPVTMHCMDGASKSGVFAAMSLLLERLELDFEVDVYQTAKQIRINRPQFIGNLEQYKFLYQIVQGYLDQE